MSRFGNRTAAGVRTTSHERLLSEPQAAYGSLHWEDSVARREGMWLPGQPPHRDVKGGAQ